MTFPGAASIDGALSRFYDGRAEEPGARVRAYHDKYDLGPYALELDISLSSRSGPRATATLRTFAPEHPTDEHAAVKRQLLEDLERAVEHGEEVVVRCRDAGRSRVVESIEFPHAVYEKDAHSVLTRTPLR